MDFNEFPLVVQNRIVDFSPAERDAYVEMYNRNKKSVFTGYICLIPLGWHYAYLNKWGSQILCIITLWGFLPWWIVDWFRLPNLVKEYNADLSLRLLNNFSWISPSKQVVEDKQISPNKVFQEWKKTNPSSTINDFYRQQKRIK